MLIPIRYKLIGAGSVRTFTRGVAPKARIYDGTWPGSRPIVFPTGPPPPPLPAVSYNPPKPPRPAPSNPTPTVPNTGQSSEIESYLKSALKELKSPESEAATISQLKRLLHKRGGKVIGESLSYESRPSVDRRVRIGTQQSDDRGTATKGIVMVAYVYGDLNSEKDCAVEMCLGFAVGARKDYREEDGAHTIMTCAHTLEAMSGRLKKQPSHTPSAVYIVTFDGHIFPVVDLKSSLPSSDMLILSKSPFPVWGPSGKWNPSSPTPLLKSLPISPYPATVGTHIAALEFPKTPLGSFKPNWLTGSVSGYKDPIGRVAETGTYDLLEEMTFNFIPEPGASGGPIIDVDNGTVVGMIRGVFRGHSEGNNARGFGVPAEKIFEMYELPNFEPASKRFKATSDS